MPLTNVPTFVTTPGHDVVQLTNASGTTAQALTVAGANGTKVVALWAVSTDTAAHDIQISILRSGVAYPIGTASVAIGAGNTSGVAAADLISTTSFPPGMMAVDNDGQSYFFLNSGDTLQVAALVAVTAAKTITIHADRGNF